MYFLKRHPRAGVLFFRRVFHLEENMIISAVRAKPYSAECDLLALPCFESQASKSGEKKLQGDPIIIHADSAMKGALLAEAVRRGFLGKRDTKMLLFTANLMPAKFVLLVGLGDKREVGRQAALEFSAVAQAEARRQRAKSVSIASDGLEKPLGTFDCARALAEGFLLSAYRFETYKTSKKSAAKAASSVSISIEGDKKRATAGIAFGQTMAECTNLARDLSNSPAADITPRELAKTAERICQDFGLEYEVFGERELKKEKMHCIMSVAKGSAEPPAFIVMKYRPRGAKKHIVFVGKGITFDSGGISLKPPRDMHEMKGDMAGAAAVMAAMMGIAKLKPKVKVTTLIPAAENLPSGKALRPGDVISSRGGKTIEIINTDAEGRLILADALSYASDLQADAIIDVATLTGGASYCCGELYSLVMSTDKKLSEKIARAAENSGERTWELPIVEEYAEGYRSGIADLNNSGKGKAQTILGALFLREFVKNKSWAHVDIAASFLSGEGGKLGPRGATGVMTRTFIELALLFG